MSTNQTKIDVSQIKERLRRGDQKRISEQLECSYQSVIFVLNGHRGTKTDLSKRILQAAIVIGAAHEEAKNNIEQNVKAQTIEL